MEGGLVNDITDNVSPTEGQPPSASRACLYAVLVVKELPGRDLEEEDLMEVNPRASLSGGDEKSSLGIGC